jgi:putative molybdopterin biosynthesis protein
VPDTRRQDDRLRLTRLARGFSQGDLARVAGVTRQAISGVESGRWSPSLDVALSLANVLESTVEELFGTAAQSEPISARLGARAGTPLHAQAARRVTLSEIAGDLVAFPLFGDRSLVPGFVPALGITQAGSVGEPQTGAAKREGAAGSSIAAVRVARAEPTLAIAGCDPALSLLQGPLQRHDPPVGLAWWPCTNASALELLDTGAAHAVAVHRSLGARSRHRPGIEIVGFACWREGLAVSPSLIGKVTSIQDVARLGLRIANRELGSEARRILDDQLKRFKIDPSTVAGYETQCSAHLLVASAISAGLCQAGITTEPAALAYGLGFVPLQEEISEFHIPRSLMGSVEVRALLDVLAGRELPAQLAALEGYDAEPCGRVLAA